MSCLSDFRVKFERLKFGHAEYVSAKFKDGSDVSATFLNGRLCSVVTKAEMSCEDQIWPEIIDFYAVSSRSRSVLASE